jgi:hypothetical protein
MRKLVFCVLITALMFLFPVVALSWEDNPAVNSGGGTSETSETDAVPSRILKDERILALENEFSEDLQALLEEIQVEPDASLREVLQMEAHALKVEQEIAMKELYLEIATELGDQERVMELQEALDQLTEPKVAQPAEDEPRQVPGTGNQEPGVPSKNADDA